MSPLNENFYAELPVVEQFDEVIAPERFVALPDDWHIAVADVRGSTRAIAEGRYKEVNALGVSVIIAITNALRPLEIPFVFGGDGATLCVPASALDATQAALRGTAALAREEYDLELRVGTLPVGLLREQGAEVLIARHRVSKHYVQAAFAGGGLDLAESLLKSGSGLLTQGPEEADFTGLECRWRAVPSAYGETVSLLVKATSGTASGDALAYQAVLAQLRTIYGDDEHCWPISLPHLALSLKSSDLAVETRLRTFRRRRSRLLYAVFIRLQVIVGMVLFRFGLRLGGVDWAQYENDVAANSDCRKLDDMFRAVLAGTPAQRESLTDWLEGRFRAGELVYGVHVARAAMLTCYIQNRSGDHFHFVDGADGGYALAAVEMKKRLKGLEAARTSTDVVSV